MWFGATAWKTMQQHRKNFEQNVGIVVVGEPGKERIKEKQTLGSSSSSPRSDERLLFSLWKNTWLQCSAAAEKTIGRHRRQNWLGRAGNFSRIGPLKLRRAGNLNCGVAENVRCSAGDQKWRREGGSEIKWIHRWQNEVRAGFEV